MTVTTWRFYWWWCWCNAQVHVCWSYYWFFHDYDCDDLDLDDDLYFVGAVCLKDKCWILACAYRLPTTHYPIPMSYYHYPRHKSSFTIICQCLWTLAMVLQKESKDDKKFNQIKPLQCIAEENWIDFCHLKAFTELTGSSWRLECYQFNCMESIDPILVAR